MKMRITAIVLLIVLSIIGAGIGVYRYLNRDEYLVAYVLDSSEYDIENDIYNLNLYIPQFDATREREMSGNYYREYDIENSKLCIDFNEDLDYLWIVDYTYCEEE